MKKIWYYVNLIMETETFLFFVLLFFNQMLVRMESFEYAVIVLLTYIVAHLIHKRTKEIFKKK